MPIPPITQVAGSVPFDNAANAYPAGDDNVQSALETRAVRMYSATQATAAAILTLTNNSPFVQFFTGTVASQIIKLPVATTLKANAFRFEFWNTSTQNIQINDNGSNNLFTVYPNTKCWAMLQDNSTSNGTWIFSSTVIGAAQTGSIACLQIRRSTTSSIVGSVAYADITFDTTDVMNNTSYINFNTGTSTTRIFISQPGLYELGYSFTYTTNTSAVLVEHQLLANGTTPIPGSYSATGDTSNNVCANKVFYNFTSAGYFTFQSRCLTAGTTETDIDLLIWAKTVNGTTSVTPTSNTLSFSFSRSGAQAAGNYLLSGNVPSSVAGQIVPGTGILNKLGVSVSSAITGTPSVFQIQRRTAVGTYSDIVGATVSISVGNYQASASALGLQLGTDEELSAYYKSGGVPTNPVATVYVVPQ